MVLISGIKVIMIKKLNKTYYRHSTVNHHSFQMLQRYLDSPVLMSFNSNPRPITEIPFPAVTICNMNKATNITATCFVID